MKIKAVQRGRDYFFKHLVDEEKASVLSKLEQLEKALLGLQYEGKVSSSNHIKKIEEIVCFLRKKYQEHTKLDEKIIFPFLSKHVPRLYPTLQFLKMESQDFQGIFEIFDKVLSEFKGKNKILLRNSIIEQVRDKGIYLVCLIKNHIHLEEKSVYRAIFQELHQEERNLLQEEIKLFLLKDGKKLKK